MACKAHKKPEKPKAAPPVKPTVKRREAPKEPRTPVFEDAVDGRSPANHLGYETL